MLTLKNVTHAQDFIAFNFACDVVVKCSGDGLWGCEAGRKVHVTGINIIKDNYEDCYSEHNTVTVNVEHDSTWDIYSDNGFAEAISKLLNMDVSFTEQGMQEDELASMEAFATQD